MNNLNNENKETLKLKVSLKDPDKKNLMPWIGGAVVILILSYFAVTSGTSNNSNELKTTSITEFQEHSETVGRIDFPDKIDTEALKTTSNANDSLQLQIDQLSDAINLSNSKQKDQTDSQANLEKTVKLLQKEKETSDNNTIALQAQIEAMELDRKNNLTDQMSLDEYNANLERQAIEQKMKLAKVEAIRQRDRDYQAKLAAELNNAIKSKPVVYDGGASKSLSKSSQGQGLQAQTFDKNGNPVAKTIDETGRDFVTQLRPARKKMAKRIFDPSFTIVQGTVIQAVLETAIDSSLPGQLIAIVTNPIESFDGSRVLIPHGSKLFGEYQTAVNAGQRRIQVAWTRVITPSGQTVELNSFGADELGRSGVTGNVNSRWGIKFGAAALISILSAAPIIGAKDITNEDTQKSIVKIGENLAGSLAPTLTEYSRLKPIIRVNQGTKVTVIVNNDLAMYP